MQAIIEALKGTPWWVYVLFFYLLSIGLKTLKPRVISLKKMFIIPTVFTVWTLYTMFSKFSHLSSIAIWGISLIVAILIGWSLSRKINIQTDKKKGLIRLPGTAITLILILLIFGTKYFFGYLYATDPLAQDTPVIFISDFITSGIITGLFLGKALSLWQKYVKVSHYERKKQEKKASFR
jgi:hypothetical protein